MTDGYVRANQSTASRMQSSQLKHFDERMLVVRNAKRGGDLVLNIRSFPTKALT
jgi:hypothetical protein